MKIKFNFVQINAEKVNKIIAGILWTLFLVSSILLLFGIIKPEVYGSFFIELAIATIFIIKKKSQTPTIALLFLAILTYTIPYIGTIYSGMVIMSVLCIVSLYLNKAILYSFGGIYSLSYIIIYYLNNQKLDSPFFTTIALISLTIAALYFVCKRSADYIQLSIQKESETIELLVSLNNMVQVIHENTTLLNSSITNCNNDISELRIMSDTISNNVGNVTEGISQQSVSIHHINEMMNTADENMNEINQLSKYLSDISQNTIQVVSQGSGRINQMGKQMNIINTAVTDTLETVGELNQSMDDVNNFLTSIKQIADQTNLLALNASIEAARAGESGAGFTVVASEIKKLAEQSSDTVVRIDKIINEIKTKIQHVFEKAGNGSTAVKEGGVITQQVLDGFKHIEDAFRQIDKHIENELIMTENENNIFMKIQDQSQNISDISQKHSKAMEDMLGTIQEQNANIEIIYELISNINSSSLKLQELIEKR